MGGRTAPRTAESAVMESTPTSTSTTGKSSKINQRTVQFNQRRRDNTDKHERMSNTPSTSTTGRTKDRERRSEETKRRAAETSTRICNGNQRGRSLSRTGNEEHSEERGNTRNVHEVARNTRQIKSRRDHYRESPEKQKGRPEDVPRMDRAGCTRRSRRSNPREKQETLWSSRRNTVHEESIQRTTGLHGINENSRADP